MLPDIKITIPNKPGILALKNLKDELETQLQPFRYCQEFDCQVEIFGDLPLLSFRVYLCKLSAGGKSVITFDSDGQAKLRVSPSKQHYPFKWPEGVYAILEFIASLTIPISKITIQTVTTFTMSTPSLILDGPSV